MRTSLQSREAATAASVAPCGASHRKTPSFQGLTPLAIDYGRFAAKDNNLPQVILSGVVPLGSHYLAAMFARPGRARR